MLFKRFLSWLNARIIGQEQKLLRLSEQGLISVQKSEQDTRSLLGQTLDKQNCANVNGSDTSLHQTPGHLDVCSKLEQMVVPASNRYQLKMISRPFKVYSLKTHSHDSELGPSKTTNTRSKIDKSRAQLSLDKPRENPARNISNSGVKSSHDEKKKVS